MYNKKKYEIRNDLSRNKIYNIFTYTVHKCTYYYYVDSPK